MKYIVKLEEPKLSIGETWEFEALDIAIEYAKDQIRRMKKEVLEKGMTQQPYVSFAICRKENQGILYQVKTDASGNPMMVMY